MTDSALNQFLASGTHSQRLAFTPTPPSPAIGPKPTYFWYETDTKNSFAWDDTASTWNQVNAVAGPVVMTQAGTTYGLALTDAFGFIQFTAATAVTVTVTKQASVAWAANTVIQGQQAGAGVVTFSPDTGVTINHVSATAHTSGQYAVATLIRTASDVWTLYGSLA